MIPTATTTITVLRVAPGDVTDDPYSGATPADRTTVITGVRAVIDRGRGSERVAGGEQGVVDLTLTCDPVSLGHTDQVRDDATGDVYDVTWTVAYPRSHVEAGLRWVQGVV